MNSCINLLQPLNKIRVYHFYNGSGGGVWSVIKNLLKFSQDPMIENHVVHAINIKVYPSYVMENIEGATTQQLCYFSPADNFYHTCRKLAECIPDEAAVIIAHDWVELGMMSNLGLQHKVFFFLHGDYPYYYDLAGKHVGAIDCFICVAANILHKLKALNVSGIPMYYQRFPVPYAMRQTNKIRNSIIYIGRLEKQKGYHLLETIAGQLAIAKVPAKWFIVGEGDAGLSWKAGLDVSFLGRQDNESVLELLTKMELCILPSLAEGMPVSLIEAMKSSVVPIVNDIEGGIKELIGQGGERGFSVAGNEVMLYVEYIRELLTNSGLRQDIQKRAKEFAETAFDPCKNTAIIEETIKRIALMPPRKKKPQKVYGSRLDQGWIPNPVTKFIRSRC